MFKKFLGWIRQVFSKLISKETVEEKLDIEIAVSPAMTDSILLCSQIYEDKAPWLCETVQSMNLGASIASEIARLITLEMESEITGSPRADYLQEQYKPVLDKVRTYTEYGCAKGTIVFKPYIDGEKIAVDAVHADRFFPTKYDSAGNITGAVFVERLTKGKKYYTRFETHDMQDSGYLITNKAYQSDTESDIGKPTTLDSIEEWSSVTPEAVIRNIDKPLFACFKVAQANTIDPSSPMGVSVYVRAVDLIREADKQFSRLLWEFEGGELAIDADDTLFRESGTDRLTLPEGKERLFRTLRGLSLESGAKAIQTFSPALRDQSIINGLNKLLQRIEFNCGLAYGTLSDPQAVDKTAEEIKSSKQRSYASVKDNQKSLQTALEQLIYAMDMWTTIGKLAPKGKCEVSFEWDDSIVADRTTEFNERMQMAQAGYLRPEMFYAWYFGMSLDQALKELPGMENLIEDANVPQADVNDTVDQIAEEVGKALNGAQTQSLITVLTQYQAGTITLGQAINVIAVAIGVSKEEAKRILEGIE